MTLRPTQRTTARRCSRAAAGVVLVLASAGCSRESSTGDAAPAGDGQGPGTSAGRTVATGPATSTAGPAADTGRVAGTVVRATGFAFVPADLLVRPGQTVTWTNDDASDHTVSPAAAGGASPLPGEGTLAPDATFSVTFSEPGTYAYACTIHPTMTGTVTVTDS